MTFIHNDKWYLSLPPCSTRVPCGGDDHRLRWDAGQLDLPAHPDAESELILAALGGEKADCVRIAETWARHAEDLMVLQVGPRDRADQIMASWNDVPRPPEESRHQGWVAMSGPPVAMPAPVRFLNPPRHGPQQVKHAMQAELERLRERNTDLLSLLALGPAFLFRLTGHIAAAHAPRLSAASRPALHAALSGRLAFLATEWIGADPGRVTGALHDGEGWGEVWRGGSGDLRITLPAGWLASVWACGLGLVARHLVVAVVRPGWPDAQVLALPEPGRDPVLLDVHGTDTGESAAHWET